MRCLNVWAPALSRRCYVKSTAMYVVEADDKKKAGVKGRKKGGKGFGGEKGNDRVTDTEAYMQGVEKTRKNERRGGSLVCQACDLR